jgi:septal ring factor EnvC (AmiA/AmiB activator)
VRGRKAVVAALLAAALAITTSLAAADDAPGTPDTLDTPDDAASIRADLRTQVTAEWDVALETRDTVRAKLAARATARAARARAAYLLLRDGDARPWVDPAERMASVRRRAAARHLLAVDHAELAILADEAVRVDAAVARLAADRALVETLAIPAPGLAWPARGDLTRRFGTFVHDDSRATLSRHGVDLDIDVHGEVHAVADGTVRYAGPLRGLDHGVVIDHGTFWSVTGKLGALAVAAGDTVTRDQELGTAATHRVYLELRIPLGRGGMPIDPERLLEPR